MKNKEFINPNNLVEPLGPYSHGTKIGELIFVAGQLPLDNETAKPLNDLSISEQTRHVLNNIKSVVEEAGSSMDNVLKTTVYLTSLEDYKELNKVYQEFFRESKPARATIQVAGLIGGVKVEIDAIAYVPQQR